MRRTFVVILLLTIVTLTVWWLMNWRTEVPPGADPWRAMPEDAIVLVELPVPLDAWRSFTNTTQFWVDLEKRPACAAWQSALLRMAEVADADERLSKLLRSQPLVISLRPRGDDLAMLMAWPLPSTPSVLQALSAMAGADLPSAFWQGGQFAFRPDSALPSMQMAWKGGLLLVGSGPLDIADAIAHLDGPYAPDGLFLRAKATLSKGSDAHILVETSGGRRLLAMLGGVSSEEKEGARGWAALDARFRPEAILASGMLFTTSDGPLYASIRKGSMGKESIRDVLPPNVERFHSIQVTDPGAYVRSMTGASEDDTLFTAYASWIQGSVGVGDRLSSTDSAAHRWAVFQTDDPMEARSAMGTRCPEGVCDTFSYRGITITRTPDIDAWAHLFGADLEPFHQPLLAVLNDKVVLANTPMDMRAAVDAWTDRNSLALDPRSAEFFDRTASDAVFTQWVDLSSGTMRTQFDTLIAEDRSAFGGFLVQMASEKEDAFVVTACLQHRSHEQHDVGMLWTVAMAAPLERPPFLVKDHISKTWQVLVQDKDHLISLISCTGKILWQRRLDGPIMGEVHQVDRYGNGKLQMVFNTKDKLYLIDRLGRDVEKFPVTLPAGAQAALCMVDYEHDHDPRFLIPVVGGKLMNMDGNGDPVKGWEPVSLPSAAIAPVAYFRIKGKDHLVVPMADGRVSVLDRRGAMRYNAALKMDRPTTFLGWRTAMDIGSCQALWMDSTGAVLSGTLEGQIDTLARATSGNALIFDLNGDGHDEVMRTTSSSITLTRGDSVLFNMGLPDASGMTAFDIPLESGEKAIGIVLPAVEQVRLLDANGQLWPGFPLRGAMNFRVVDINLDGVLELVTATPEGVVLVHALPDHP